MKVLNYNDNIFSDVWLLTMLWKYYTNLTRMVGVQPLIALSQGPWQNLTNSWGLNLRGIEWIYVHWALSVNSLYSSKSIISIQPLFCSNAYLLSCLMLCIFFLLFSLFYILVLFLKFLEFPVYKLIQSAILWPKQGHKTWILSGL